ncbi:Uncharacterized protein K02A2.6 [Stylophora pistillata]|uniref:Uncharacterized protein K02A2.6 n=2 Tax=Stylophora pistillata TaxID=50429 RepID=A0A2B4R968_STYPI|nr:Uncharacterized protein K02A2.6 [Stylophora pistillata]
MPSATIPKVLSTAAARLGLVAMAKNAQKEVSSLGVLSYFDPNAETVIETDASLKGLGAVLLQDGKPVCYASKALTETEQQYSNIEREALGVVWGLERFHYFIYGKSCTIHTDHKPLEAIFKKKLSNCPARLQRFVLRALKYDVTIKYVKGAEVPIADALSRVSPQPAPLNDEFPQLDIHQITKNLPASPIKLQQIRNEIASDPTLSKLRNVIHEGWPATREKCPQVLHDYWNFREELTIEDGLILKQERIVMPTTLRHDTLNTIHQGHLGQEKCLLRARSAVFWPGITRDVTNLVQDCATCQAYQRKQQKQPILQPEPPSYPWQMLSSDLFEFRGNQYLLISDKYSKFPIVRKLTNTTSRAIINHLKSIFAEHGIPECLTTDNGPQYASQEFCDFMETYGVEHVTSSPMYPQSNGSAERMVQTVENILKKCDNEGEDPYLGLLPYRTTPISSNLKSPAELLNNRKLRTTLPMPKRVSVTDSTSKTKEELYQRQKLQAFYYDKAAGPILQPFRPAQPINIYDHHTTRWEQGPVVRPAKEPRSYIVKNDRTEGIYRRTRSQLKLRPEVKDNSIKDPPSSDPEKAASQDSSTTPPQDGQTYTTRSGRTSKPPNRLDF